MRFPPTLIFVMASLRSASTAAFVVGKNNNNNKHKVIPTTMFLQNQFLSSYSSPTLPVSMMMMMMAGDGIVCASKESIRDAMANPETTILDVRGVDEIIKDGYLNPNGLQYIHSQCTKDDAPLLSIAAEDMIRNKTAPVLVYCALGFRASKAKAVLESKGYTNVLLGGGLSDLDFLKRE